MLGKLIDRFMWVVDLLIILVLAAFLAAGVDQFLTGIIDGAIRSAVADQKGARRPGGRRPPSKQAERFVPVDGTDILRRNIFDSETGPLDGVVEWTAEYEETSVAITDVSDPNAMIPRCSAPFVLQASYASPDFPDHSFIAVTKGNETELLSEGDSIDSYTVSRITWRYAFMNQSGGSKCYLDLWNEDPPAGAPPGAPKTAAQKLAMAQDKPKAKTGTSAADFQALLDKSISDISATEKNIDRTLIDYLVENKHMLMQSGRVLPNVEGDSINGFKVYGIRKTSLWGKLGIHNGDVVQTINGMTMDGPDKAYEAFANLSGSDSMDVIVLRHGNPMTFNYNIK